MGNSSFCNDKHEAGVMIPIPAFYHYKARIKEFGLFEVIAYLIELKCIFRQLLKQLHLLVAFFPVNRNI